MENIVIVLILIMILGGSISYIVKEKRKGTKCIGCPYSAQCSAATKAQCNKTPYK